MSQYRGPLFGLLPLVLSALDALPAGPLTAGDFRSLSAPAILGSLFFFSASGGTPEGMDDALEEAERILTRSSGRISPGPLPDSQRLFFLLRALYPEGREIAFPVEGGERLVPLGEEGEGSVGWDPEAFVALPGWYALDWRTFDALLVVLLARKERLFPEEILLPFSPSLPFLPGEVVEITYLEEESGSVLLGPGVVMEPPTGVLVGRSLVPGGLVVEANSRLLCTWAA